MKYIIGVIVVVILAVGAFFVFGGKDTKDANPTNQNTSSEPVSGDQTDTTSSKVSISNLNFSPTDLTVKKGTLVTWTNNDSVAHTVTVDTGDGPKSDTLNSGQTYSFMFNNVGTFNYHCNFHPQMHGTIKVTEN